MTPSHPASGYYIGLMSGTSMDSTDAVLARFSDQQTITDCSRTSLSYPPELQQQLENLCCNRGTPDDLMAADAAVGDHFARCVQKLLTEQQIADTAIEAIGSHGQTLRHRPDHSHPFSLQVGDPHRIAEQTGITTIADFRRRDMSAGGQGAPLAPAFHQWCFGHPGERRVLVNIGGMANITWLPGEEEQIRGFDTGPGNRLMDLWCQEHLKRAYDDKGRWADSGNVIPELLEQMLQEPYFARKGPRSTGREHFNAHWLREHTANYRSQPTENIQRTLLELSVETICRGIEQLGEAERVYLCGGGAFNQTLTRTMAERLPRTAVSTSDELGMDPQSVEGAAFAWLARQHCLGRAGNLPTVTGAKGPRVLGAAYPGAQK